MTHRQQYDDIHILFRLVKSLEQTGDYETRKKLIAAHLSGGDDWIKDACVSIVEDCRRDENRGGFSVLAHRMAEGFIKLRNHSSNEEISQLLPELRGYLDSANAKLRGWTNAPTKIQISLIIPERIRRFFRFTR